MYPVSWSQLRQQMRTPGCCLTLAGRVLIGWQGTAMELGSWQRMGKGSRTGTGGSSVGSGGHFVHKTLWYLLYDNLRVAGHPGAYGTTLSLSPLGRTLSEHSGPPSPPWSWPHWGCCSQNCWHFCSPVDGRTGGVWGLAGASKALSGNWLWGRMHSLAWGAAFLTLQRRGLSGKGVHRAPPEPAPL